jgi:peptide chain release factor 2
VLAADPAFWKDQQGAQKVQRRRKRIEADQELLRNLRSQEDDARVLVEWREAGEDVEKDLRAALEVLEATIEGAEFQKMLGGEHDRANAILSINSGAGGTESQDWAEMLLRMYLRWCEQKGFKRDITEIQSGEEAGIKSVTVMVQGEYAFGYLSAEAGVHRLVRISPFDSAARRHTSFASVFAWPQIDEDIEIEVQDKDLRVDTYRSSGAGGQHVNVTDSAVRITHLPTGIVVSCQNERSQIRNREVAMKVLKSRLYDLEMQKQQAAIAKDRRTQVGTGERSEKIRTYNFRENRITDHRIGHTMHQLTDALDGDLTELIDAATTFFNSEKLKEATAAETAP